MSYNGYRVKIGDTTVSNLLISSGSYSILKSRRLIRQWTDANGKDHYDYFQNPKVTIKFSLRERTLAEHESIKNLFTTYDNLYVEYWDDYDCAYKTGYFRMEEPKISHAKAPGADIRYSATPIELKEY